MAKGNNIRASDEVEKEKEARVEVERSTRSALKGVPKATPLKRAFRKLWALYEPPLKLYTKAERDTENVVHHTPSAPFAIDRSTQPGLRSLGEMGEMRI
jgi:hypothetical protein